MADALYFLARHTECAYYQRSTTTKALGMQITYPLSDVFHSVAAGIQQNLAGTPVFVRITLFGLAKPIDLADGASKLLSVAEGWLGQPAATIRAVGAPDEQLSLLARFAGGATAILSVHRTPGTGDNLDLQLTGNHGTICFEGQAGALPRFADLAGVPADAALAERIREASRTNSAVQIQRDR